MVCEHCGERARPRMACSGASDSGFHREASVASRLGNGSIETQKAEFWVKPRVLEGTERERTEFCGSLIFCDGGTDAMIHPHDYPSPWSPFAHGFVLASLLAALRTGLTSKRVTGWELSETPPPCSRATTVEVGCADTRVLRGS